MDGCSNVALGGASSISRMYLLAFFPLTAPERIRKRASYIECEVMGEGSTIAEFCACEEEFRPVCLNCCFLSTKVVFLCCAWLLLCDCVSYFWRKTLVCVLCG
jgi:hypothetical protein